jgi:hypothetical protein
MKKEKEYSKPELEIINYSDEDVLDGSPTKSTEEYGPIKKLNNQGACSKQAPFVGLFL